MDLVVVGGGTGTNSILRVFSSVGRRISYVIPISDNGGSTSEILRVLGGPAIGDARSRLVRLMPSGPLRDLLEYRLRDELALAHQEWTLIVEGRHRIWGKVPQHFINMYRAFLIKVNSEILLRNRSGNEFQFSQASIGNLLLSGARIFFGSLDSAIEFVSSTARIDPRFSVLPAMNTNFTHHIAAELVDGSLMVGQTEISHPSTSPELATSMVDEYEYSMPFNHPKLNASQISFSKEADQPLPARLDRVFYINPMGAEIKPKPSGRVLQAASTSQSIIYSVGSLYTSIIPIVLLQGVAAKIRTMPGPKIFMLNGSNDRETTDMNALDHIKALVDACVYSLDTQPAAAAADIGTRLQLSPEGLSAHTSDTPSTDWTQFVTHLIYPIEANDTTSRDAVSICTRSVAKRGITCVPCLVDSNRHYNLDSLEEILKSITDNYNAFTRPPSTINCAVETP